MIQYCLVVDSRYFVANLTCLDFLKWPLKGNFWIRLSVLEHYAVAQKMTDEPARSSGAPLTTGKQGPRGTKHGLEVNLEDKYQVRPGISPSP